MNGQNCGEFRRKKISMVFQKFALFPHRTVLENVEYGLEVQGIDKQKRREKAMQALELVGLKGLGEQSARPAQRRHAAACRPGSRAG